MKDYNKDVYYETEIVPILELLKSKCNENRIPFFVAFGTKMVEGKFPKGDGIKCTALLPEVLSLDSRDSFFARFVNVLNGAQTIYSEYGEEKIVDLDSEGDTF